MSAANMEMDISSMPEFQEACWPIMMIWERINHAYASDSPPKHFGLKKKNYGFKYWVFNSHKESYSVVWDSNRSYWKVKAPFGPCLFFIGPGFIDKSGNGLRVPPMLSVLISDTDVLMPASPTKVKTRMLKITRYVLGKDWDTVTH
ncbi:hypothetical protein GDO81_017236 [Engystomops pustulosus]|uniref:Uncharacterized protein n=1 Tax=Engystomops pustulosus TaxID=76066 RepID=A0AAV7AE77_ENGPU|nr:hypothetical protein GDO81_017236 [Engystomops pustulosus]